MSPKRHTHNIFLHSDDMSLPGVLAGALAAWAPAPLSPSSIFTYPIQSNPIPSNPIPYIPAFCCNEDPRDKTKTHALPSRLVFSRRQARPMLMDKQNDAGLFFFFFFSSSPFFAFFVPSDGIDAVNAGNGRENTRGPNVPTH